MREGEVGRASGRLSYRNYDGLHGVINVGISPFRPWDVEEGILEYLVIINLCHQRALASAAAAPADMSKRDRLAQRVTSLIYGASGCQGNDRF